MKSDVRLSDDESDSETENADETDKSASLEQVCIHSRWAPVSYVMFVITREPRLVEVVLLEIYSANKSRHLLILFNPLMSTVAV